MHIARADFNGSPNVGLSGFATEKILLLGEHIDSHLTRQVREALGDVTIHHTRIAGTGMPGVFLAGNSNALLVPSIAFEGEITQLKQLGLPVHVLHSQHTCLGNNIACNDRGAILSTEFSDEEHAAIEAALGVPCARMDIAGLKTPGALILTRGDKGVIHRDASPDEIAAVERMLGVTLEPATVHLGTPYLRSGVLHNHHGFVIGTASGGPEIVHLDQALGYADE